MANIFYKKHSTIAFKRPDFIKSGFCACTEPVSQRSLSLRSFYAFTNKSDALLGERSEGTKRTTSFPPITNIFCNRLTSSTRKSFFYNNSNNIKFQSALHAGNMNIESKTSFSSGRAIRLRKNKRLSIAYNLTKGPVKATSVQYLRGFFLQYLLLQKNGYFLDINKYGLRIGRFATKQLSMREPPLARPSSLRSQSERSERASEYVSSQFSDARYDWNVIRTPLFTQSLRNSVFKFYKNFTQSRTNTSKIRHKRPFFCYWLLPFFGFITSCSEYNASQNKITTNMRETTSVFDTNSEARAVSMPGRLTISASHSNIKYSGSLPNSFLIFEEYNFAHSLCSFQQILFKLTNKQVDSEVHGNMFSFQRSEHVAFQIPEQRPNNISITNTDQPANLLLKSREKANLDLSSLFSNNILFELSKTKSLISKIQIENQSSLTHCAHPLDFNSLFICELSKHRNNLLSKQSLAESYTHRFATHHKIQKVRPARLQHSRSEFMSSKPFYLSVDSTAHSLRKNANNLINKLPIKLSGANVGSFCFFNNGSVKESQPARYTHELADVLNDLSNQQKQGERSEGLRNAPKLTSFAPVLSFIKASSLLDEFLKQSSLCSLSSQIKRRALNKQVRTNDFTNQNLNIAQELKPKKRKLTKNDSYALTSFVLQSLKKTLNNRLNSFLTQQRAHVLVEPFYLHARNARPSKQFMNLKNVLTFSELLDKYHPQSLLFLKKNTHEPILTNQKGDLSVDFKSLISELNQIPQPLQIRTASSPILMLTQLASLVRSPMLPTITGRASASCSSWQSTEAIASLSLRSPFLNGNYDNSNMRRSESNSPLYKDERSEYSEYSIVGPSVVQDQGELRMSASEYVSRESVSTHNLKIISKQFNIDIFNFGLFFCNASPLRANMGSNYYYFSTYLNSSLRKLTNYVLFQGREAALLNLHSEFSELAKESSLSSFSNSVHVKNKPSSFLLVKRKKYKASQFVKYKTLALEKLLRGFFSIKYSEPLRGVGIQKPKLFVQKTLNRSRIKRTLSLTVLKNKLATHPFKCPQYGLSQVRVSKHKVADLRSYGEIQHTRNLNPSYKGIATASPFIHQNERSERSDRFAAFPRPEGERKQALEQDRQIKRLSEHRSGPKVFARSTNLILKNRSFLKLTPFALNNLNLKGEYSLRSSFLFASQGRAREKGESSGIEKVRSRYARLENQHERSKTITRRKLDLLKRRKKKQKKETRRRKKRKRIAPRPYWIRSQIYSRLKKKDKNNITLTARDLDFAQELKNNSLRSQLTTFALWANKDLYTISRPVLGDLKRILWKSYWLRSHYIPYLNGMKKNLTKIKSSKVRWHFYTILQTLITIFLGSSSPLQKNPVDNKMWTREYTRKCNARSVHEMNLQANAAKRFNQTISLTSYAKSSEIGSLRLIFDSASLNRYFSNCFGEPKTFPFSSWQSAINLAEYNRLVYERIQNFVLSIRENLNMSGKIKTIPYNVGRHKLVSNTPTKDFWLKVGKLLTLEIQQKPIPFYYGYLSPGRAERVSSFLTPSKPRLYWALAKTNNGTAQAPKRKQLWAECTKLREQTKTNKTKKFLAKSQQFLNHFLERDIREAPEGGIKNNGNKMGTNIRRSELSEFDQQGSPGRAQRGGSYWRRGRASASSDKSQENLLANLQAIKNKIRKKEEKLEMLIAWKVRRQILQRTNWPRLRALSWWTACSHNTDILKSNVRIAASSGRAIVSRDGNAHKKGELNSVSRRALAISRKIELASEYVSSMESNQRAQRTSVARSEHNKLSEGRASASSETTSIASTGSQFSIITNIERDYARYYLWIYSFIFHFCCIVSLISISQIRSLIKICFIGAQRIFKASLAASSIFKTSLFAKFADSFALILDSRNLYLLDYLRSSFFFCVSENKENQSMFGANNLQLVDTAHKFAPIQISSFARKRRIGDSQKEGSIHGNERINASEYVSRKSVSTEIFYYTIYLTSTLIRVPMRVLNSLRVQGTVAANEKNEGAQRQQSMASLWRRDSFMMFASLSLLTFSQLIFNISSLFYKVITQGTYTVRDSLQTLIGTVSTLLSGTSGGEFILDWIAYLFLVEWSADLSATVPENYLNSFYITIMKFSRSIYCLNIYQFLYWNIESTKSSEINFFISFVNTNNNPLLSQLSSTRFPEAKYDVALNVSALSNIFSMQIERLFSITLELITNFVSSALSYSLASQFLQRRIRESYEIFLEKILAPDTDLLVRQKKGLIFWDIWADNLKIVAEDSSINISELTSLKEEQIKLLEKLQSYEIFGSGRKLPNVRSSVLRAHSARHNGILVGRAELIPFVLRDSVNLKSLWFSLKIKEENGLKHQSLQPHPGRYFRSAHRFACEVKERRSSVSKESNMVNKRILMERLIYKQKPLSKLAFYLLNLMTDSGLTSRPTRYEIKRRSETATSPSGAQLNKPKLAIANNGKTWGANQASFYQAGAFAAFSDLFIDLHPPKSFSQLNATYSLRASSTPAGAIGTIVCQIFSGIFTKQISRNLLIVGASGNQKSLLIQAIAGETELKIITDNAYRYSMVYQGVAVGIKLLRDVFDALALHTPCLFLLEDIHAIGERRPFLISDDENTKATESSFGSSNQTGLDEKNQIIYQLSKHVITHYQKPYRGDFSLLIPTNHFCFSLYSQRFASAQARKRNTLAPTNPMVTQTTEAALSGSGSFFSASESVNSANNKQKSDSIYASSLQLTSNQLLAPPATSPFSVFIKKESHSARRPQEVVREMPWSGFPGEQYSLINKSSYSIRVKVALLADMAIANLSVKLDMITDLLVIIDSVKGNRGFVVFATTQPSVLASLDPALRRPGRLDETIFVPLAVNAMMQNNSERAHVLADARPQQACEGTTWGLTSNLLSRWEIFKANLGPLQGALVGTQNVGFPKGISIDFSQSQLTQYSNIASDHFQFGTYFLQSSNNIQFYKQMSNWILYSSRESSQSKFDEITFFLTNLKNRMPRSGQGERSEEGREYVNAQANFDKTNIVRTNAIKTYQTLLSRSYFVVSQFMALARLRKRLPARFTRTLDNDLARKARYSAHRFANAHPVLVDYEQMDNTSLNQPKSLFAILYAPPCLFQKYLISFMAGKIGEIFYENSNYNGAVAALYSDKNFYKARLQRSSVTSSMSLQRSTTLYGIDKTWRYLTSFVMQFVQKRFLYNNKLAGALRSNLLFGNNSSLYELPSPPSTSILLPAKRSLNYKRSFYNQQMKVFNLKDGKMLTSNISINDRRLLHQQQRLVKRLYGIPIKEYFRSETIANRLTSFGNSAILFGQKTASEANVQKPTSMNWFYRNRILNRHRNYLTNQWWNGQLPEHNKETTLGSDIDWRFNFVESLGDIFIDFPDSFQYYNPRNRRWILTTGSWNFWYDYSQFILGDIYYNFIFDSFVKAYNILNDNREMLDFYASSVLSSESVSSRAIDTENSSFVANAQTQEIHLLKGIKRFYFEGAASRPSLAIKM
uniref:Cell division protein n=1 Tax=Characiochloris acuminata TaxID=167768 RepID=A0A0S2LPZ1_9CHLO|nr:cell division protein [Characiochloris acuminata]ALO63273.1 cell division protein [Characiochloris acuminata]